MSEQPERSGGCLCGAVRFTVSEGPILGRVCWCKVCQKLGAGGPAVGAAFKSAAVTVTVTVAVSLRLPSVALTVRLPP